MSDTPTNTPINIPTEDFIARAIASYLSVNDLRTIEDALKKNKNFDLAYKITWIRGRNPHGVVCDNVDYEGGDYYDFRREYRQNIEEEK